MFLGIFYSCAWEPSFICGDQDFKIEMKTELLRQVYQEVTGKRLKLEPPQLNIDFHVYGGGIKLLDEQIRKILKSRKRREELDVSDREIDRIAERFLHKFKE